MLRILQQFILTALFAVFASQASAMFIQADWLDPTQPGVGTNRYAYSNNDPINRIDPLGNESVFVGGAGDNGEYKDDLVEILDNLGVENPRTSSPPVTVGVFDPAGKLGLGNMLMDALAVIGMNQDPINEGGISLIPYDPQLSPQHPNDQQYNLIGYSWGTAVVANQAIGEASKGITVDNLVLIGAPLNQSMMDRLNTTDGIRNVSVINLTNQGDPLSAGMSDLEIISSVPSLVGQMSSGTGHFYYSPSGPIGHQRRIDLGNQLIDLGIR